MEFLSYIILGAIAGTLAGLLGVGGGLIIVPVLAIIFSSLQFPADNIMHMALATSLTTIVFTSISSVYAHHKKGAVLWPMFRAISPAILLGSFVGGYIASQLSTGFLKPFFGLYAIIVAAQMFYGKQPAAAHDTIGNINLSISGTIIGIISAIVGIGGGSMTVPYLAWHNINIRNAVATSSAVGLPIAIAGASGYLVDSLQLSQLPEYAFGFIYLPAFISIVSASVLFAPLGARLAHTLPIQQLKKIFALVMLVIGLKMLML